MNPIISIIDQRLFKWADRIVKEINIPHDAAKRIASTIEKEFDTAKTEFLQDIKNLGPITPKRRLYILEGQIFWKQFVRPKILHAPEPPQGIISKTWWEDSHKYALLMSSLYMNYIYVGDGFFEFLKKHAPSGSVTKKVAQYIRENPLRALRNALSHANWYLTTNGIKYFARKGSDPNEPMAEFHASPQDMEFYDDFVSFAGWAALFIAVKASGETGVGIENA
jgi:hypothetical protein